MYCPVALRKAQDQIAPGYISDAQMPQPIRRIDDSVAYTDTGAMISDLNKHGDEFRLRILATNKCNLDCSFCLNDFQTKGDEFIDLDFVAQEMQAYTRACHQKGYKPIVNVSGGEPGCHPKLLELLRTIKRYDCHLCLNTNGKALLQPGIYDLVDKIHLHTKYAYYDLPWSKLLVQKVFTADTDELTERRFIIFYGRLGVPVKYFVDFFGDETLNAQYETFIQRMRIEYPQYVIKSRFTGIQQNRGLGCAGCTNRCITLKAHWLFPNGMGGPCPQKAIYGHVASSEEFHRLEKETVYVQDFHGRNR